MDLERPAEKAKQIIDQRVLTGTGKPRPAALARYLRVAADAQHPGQFP
jgi:hypothetical protein